MLPISLLCAAGESLLQKSVSASSSELHLTGTVLTVADLSVLTEKLVPIAYQWFALGIQLGFDPGVLKGFQTFGDTSRGLAELLTRWLQRTNPPSTLQSLIDVVKGNQIAHQVLAGKLEKECGDFPSIKGKPS